MEPSGPYITRSSAVEEVGVGGGVLVVARVQVLPEHLDRPVGEMRALVDAPHVRQAVVVVPHAQGEAGDQDQAEQHPLHAVHAGQRRWARPLVLLTGESTGLARTREMPETAATERDERHLLRSIELAAEARGHTSPNPLVGAVVVKNGRVIGEGFHAGPGEAHAERVALERLQRGPRRRHALRLARALRPPRPNPALHGGDPRGRDRARRDRLRRPDSEGLRPRPRHPARRGRPGGRAWTARSRRPPGCSTSPSASTRAPAARWWSSSPR